jgi:phytanoyl-CoA hydroxylase
MQSITVTNGCLFVSPGTHLGPLLKHEYPNDGIVNKAYHGIQNMGVEGMLNVEMEAGDTLYFHPLLIHGSGPNFSPDFRKAISCHYASSQVEEFDVKGSLQEELALEIEGMMLRKAGIKVKYMDIWRLKSVHVAGESSLTFHLGWRKYWLQYLAFQHLLLKKLNLK